MDAKSLQGHRVAFTGKLASMTRRQAVDLVRAFGGQWAVSVAAHTSLVVVGQEGWPLQKDGRLTRKLRLARALQRSRPLKIITEAELLTRLGLESAFDGARRLSTAQLTSLLHVPGERIRHWVRLGLVRPIDTLLGVHYFDFRQVAWAKALCRFAETGVRPERIRRSLRQLRQWLPDVQEPLAQLALLEKDGRLLVRLSEGGLAEPTGQLHFDFSEEPAVTVPVSHGPQTAEQWFELGCDHEDAGRLAEAVQAYRQALLLGGSEATVCFNLANALYALGRRQQAVERFWQAVEMDPEFAQAWNNLGNVLAELGQQEEALAALERALHIEPLYADAHYNLADTLDQAGRKTEAAPHWQAYLRQDQTSRWADYARQRLAATERPRQA